MKILICIPCLFTGGTEIQTLNLVRALVQEGHQVTTACYFEHNKQMVAQYQNAGSNVVCFQPEGKRIGGWKGILFLYKALRQILKTEKPDVVHVQYMAPGAIPIFLLRSLGMKNIIATTHTAADIYPNLRLIHFVQKHCVRAFTCITELAERSYFGTAQFYSETLPLKKRNHFTIYNALPSYIHLRTQTRKFDKETLTVGVVSRLERIKGMDLVIPAFASALKRNPAIRLLIVGDGSLTEEMHRQARHYEIESCIEWTGRQEQKQLEALYDDIDILLMPSRSEGFGLTAIEGMARGCVVIASRTGGLPEVVKDGEVGLLHRSEDIDDLADKLVYLLDDKKRIEQFSAKALAHVSRFGFEQYKSTFCNLYQRLF